MVLCAGKSFRKKEMTTLGKRDLKTRYGCRLHVPFT